MPDDRLAEVLGARSEARDSGYPSDPTDLIAEHPNLAYIFISHDLSVVKFMSDTMALNV